MTDLDRRTLLRGLPAAALGLAGCSSEGPAPGLHAVRTVLVHRPGYADADYPEDVAVRVDVENTSRERLRGTLVVTLTRAADASRETRTWTRRRDFTLQSVTTRSYILTFESVFSPGDAEDAFSGSARVETDTPE